MREIKFRAWDKESKWMDFDIFVGPHGIYDRASRTYDTPNIEIEWLGDDFYLMQFTGLRDKNGKEIYEGDIVFVRKAKEQREVVFHGGAFCVVSGGDHYTLNQTRAEGLEVVGNIYEHKHLLEE